MFVLAFRVPFEVPTKKDHRSNFVVLMPKLHSGRPSALLEHCRFIFQSTNGEGGKSCTFLFLVLTYQVPKINRSKMNKNSESADLRQFRKF